MHRLSAHLRGNAVGYVALFIALGGSSYAAVRLAPNSVTTTTIAKRAVTNAKLAPKAMAARVERAAAYALRWSDHAPVTVEYG